MLGELKSGVVHLNAERVDRYFLKSNFLDLNCTDVGFFTEAQELAELEEEEGFWSWSLACPKTWDSSESSAVGWEKFGGTGLSASCAWRAWNLAIADCGSVGVLDEEEDGDDEGGSTSMVVAGLDLRTRELVLFWSSQINFWVFWA